MRVLIVTPYPVLPPTHGGRVRTFRLATAVAAARSSTSVDVLCPWHPSGPARRFQVDGVDFQPQFFLGNVLPVLLPERFVPPLVALSLQPFGPGPRRRLRDIDSYDVVQFEFCAHPHWMERLRGRTRLVYSAHNVEWDFWRSHRDPHVPASALHRLRALEARAVAASDLVVASTGADEARLRELYGGRPAFAVVPNGFDDALLELDRAALRDRSRIALGISPTERVLLFVGGRAVHNRTAVRFLERELAPRLSRDTTIVVVGEAARFVERATGTVRPLGYVPELAIAFASADVALNPISHGSGSNLKLPEYLAAGLPVVTTRFGMRGFEQFVDCLTVAELDAFADAVLDPVAPPRSIRADLRPWTWANIGRRLHELYERLSATPSEEVTAAEDATGGGHPAGSG
jgi:glycosyltransferase involved in cell wall biosynthesis